GSSLCRARDFYRVQAVQLGVVLALLTMEVAAILVASSSGSAVALLLVGEAGCAWGGALLGQRRGNRPWIAAASTSAEASYRQPPRGLWLTVGVGVLMSALALLVARYWGAATSGAVVMGTAVQFGGVLGSFQSAADEEAARREVLLMQPGRGGSQRLLRGWSWLRGRL
ncbi:MAG: hypothetical protein ACP5PW_05720, partial [Candidatus Dormibacteria bacterium]